MTWRLSFEGATFDEADLQLVWASKALEVCGGRWSDLHPLVSPDHLAALLAAFVAQETDETFELALARVSLLPQGLALSLVEAVSDGVG